MAVFCKVHCVPYTLYSRQVAVLHTDKYTALHTAPTFVPTHAPSTAPSFVPTAVPTTAPTGAPTVAPSEVPTTAREYYLFISLYFMTEYIINII